jgi:hypothetical protein
MSVVTEWSAREKRPWRAATGVVVVVVVDGTVVGGTVAVVVGTTTVVVVGRATVVVVVGLGTVVVVLGARDVVVGTALGPMALGFVAASGRALRLSARAEPASKVGAGRDWEIWGWGLAVVRVTGVAAAMEG